jgi:hypothetical protein
MTLTPDDKKKLPIDLLDLAPMLDKDKQQVRESLISLMLPTNIKKLSEELKLEEVIEKYKNEDGRLVCNLIFSTIVVNESRKIIKQSSTHPENNENLKNNLVSDIKLANEIDDLRQIKPDEDEDEEDEEKSFNFYVDLIKNSKKGNCEEFSMYGYYIFKKNGYTHLVEIFSIKNGDHLFIVIDRDPESDKNDFTTWGPHCVVCDGWMGEVYPAHLLPSYLRSYKEVKIEGEYKNTLELFSYNILTLLNPNIHSVKRMRPPFHENPSTLSYQYTSPFLSQKKMTTKRKEMTNDNTFRKKIKSSQ